MNASELISSGESGYHIVRLAGLGEVHIEFSSRADDKNRSTLWEASIYSPQDQSGSLRTVLHVIADSRDELIGELDRALFYSEETDPDS
jgi:hypothetical protein